MRVMINTEINLVNIVFLYETFFCLRDLIP